MRERQAGNQGNNKSQLPAALNAPVARALSGNSHPHRTLRLKPSFQENPCIRR
jgi:hypothetical protein